VPTRDRRRFAAWSAALATALDRTAAASPALVERGNDAAAGMTDYFRELVAQRRSAPVDDLLNGMLTAFDGDDRLSEDELLANCVLLFFAGHETTVNLIGNGLLALLGHQLEMERLREQPGLAGQAVEELLRFDSPVQRTGRVALEDVELADGHVIRKGDHVSLLIGAANRDPLQFERPDSVELMRPGAHRHLAFAAGIHYCLGAPLARLEAQLAFTSVLRRFPHMQPLDQPPRWRPTFTLRGLLALHVRR
jgi:cytochrome P450